MIVFANRSRTYWVGGWGINKEDVPNQKKFSLEGLPKIKSLRPLKPQEDKEPEGGIKMVGGETGTSRICLLSGVFGEEMV